MKIKKAISICEGSGQLYLYDTETGDQWVSNGPAAYRMEGSPQLTVEQLCNLYDITGKKLEKVFVKQEPAPESICWEDACYEFDAVGANMILTIDGHEIQPIFLKEGIIGLDTQYLGPITAKEQFRRIVVRYRSSGIPYFAIKDGLIVQAIIFPYEFKSVAETALQELADRVCAGVWHRRATDPEPPQADPDTGEVIEDQDELEEEE